MHTSAVRACESPQAFLLRPIWLSWWSATPRSPLDALPAAVCLELKSVVDGLTLWFAVGDDAT
jgi:hypothetical protein